MCLLRVSGAEQRRLNCRGGRAQMLPHYFAFCAEVQRKKKQEEAEEQEGKLSQED